VRVMNSEVKDNLKELLCVVQSQFLTLSQIFCLMEVLVQCVKTEE